LVADLLAEKTVVGGTLDRACGTPRPIGRSRHFLEYRMAGFAGHDSVDSGTSRAKISI
jgi:hypothetical protein